MDFNDIRNVLTTAALTAALLAPTGTYAFAEEALPVSNQIIEEIDMTQQADVLEPEEIISIEVEELPSYSSAELGTFSSLEAAFDAAMIAVKDYGTTFSFTYTGNMSNLKTDFSNAFNLVMQKPGNDYFHGTIKSWSYSYTSAGKISVNLEYRATLEQEQFVTKRVKEIAAELSQPGMSDFDKVLAVNEYVVTNTIYSRTAKTTPHHVYAYLTEGKAVCQAYALLTYRLLTEMGVEARYVVGYAGEAHAWNSVKIDGVWYHLDTTWNDPSFNGKDTLTNVGYKYFLVTSETLRKDHSWEEGIFPEATDNRHSYMHKIYLGIRHNGEIYYSDSTNNYALSKFNPETKHHETLLNRPSVHLAGNNEYIYFADLWNEDALTSYNIITKKTVVIDKVKASQLQIIDGFLHYKAGSTTKKYELPLSAEEQAVRNVDLKISTLSEFSTEAMLQDARNAYTALTDEQKAKVTSLAKLTQLEAAYPVNKAVADKMAIEVAKYSVTSSRADLLSIIAQFDKLTPAQQSHVSNKALIDSFKGVISEQNAKIEAVEKAIKALKTSSKTYLADIAEARKAYDALTDELKSAVASLSALTTAEANTEKAKTAYNLIDKLDGSSIEAIMAARAAYTDVPSTFRKHVTNLKALTTFEATVKNAIAAAKAIDAIDPASTKFVAQVKTARKAYDKAGIQQSLIPNAAEFLDTEKQALVFEQIAKLKVGNAKFIAQATKAKTNYDALTNKNLVTNIDKLNEAIEGIKPVQAMIAQIHALDGKSVVAITEARAAFNELSKIDRKYVTNIKALTALEKKFKSEISAIKAINAIKVDDKKFVAQVKSARKALNKVSDANKVLVTNAAAFETIEKQALLFEQISKLKPSAKYIDQVTTLKTAYDALAVKDLITNADKLTAAVEAVKPAQAVVAQIDALDDSSVEAIIAARTAYASLDKATQKFVTNVKQLAALEKKVKNPAAAIKAIKAIDPASTKFVSQVKSARKAYDKAGAQQSLVTNSTYFLDIEKQAAVFEQISKLKVSSAKYIAEVTAAKGSYDALTNKNLVTNAEVLIKAVETIKPAQAIIAQIEALDGKSIEAVAAARTAFNALPKAEQKYVTNSKALKTLEKQLTTPIKAMNLIEETKALDVSTSSYFKKAAAMKKAYVALSVDHKALVTNTADYNYHLALYEVKNAQKTRNWTAVTIDTFKTLAIDSVTTSNFEAVKTGFNELKAGTGTATVLEITTNVEKFIK